jgi:hypothetical protein
MIIQENSTRYWAEVIKMDKKKIEETKSKTAGGREVIHHRPAQSLQ